MKKLLMLFAFMICATRPTLAQEGFPSVSLPPELDRVLRDYERGWRTSAPESLASLFTVDGFAMPSRRPPVRGRRAIAEEYQRAGGELVLRALAFEIGDSLGYIIGAYGYGDVQGDSGKFVLALRKDPSGRWLIAADIDSGNGN